MFGGACVWVGGFVCGGDLFQPILNWSEKVACLNSECPMPEYITHDPGLTSKILS